jgi:organic radical activating enzyme
VKTYVIKERFRTIQGEGFHVGTPALFIRFAGCNMWNSAEDDRERDAVRNRAACPRWCDTDFVGGERLTADQVVDHAAASRPTPLVVLTGGEPLLQVDVPLLAAVHRAMPEATIAIETNGTVRPSWWWNDDEVRGPGYPVVQVVDGWQHVAPRPWMTMSPKRARYETVLPWADELKLVVPDYDPRDWEDFPARHRFVQPRADRSVRDENQEFLAASWVAGGTRWRLSLQTHKIVRMP